MKVLFYLPVVTAWWYDNIVLPLIRTMTVSTEVHVLAPLLWQSTGLGSRELIAAAAIDGVSWHIIDDPSHTSLRTSPADPDGLVDFVRTIGPDLTFCRSADAETPARFPGQVRFLMESHAPPFPDLTGSFLLRNALLVHGEMASLSAADREQVDASFAATWTRYRHQVAERSPFDVPRNQALANMDIDPRSRVLALPLEYAHEENFFKMHERCPDPVELIRNLVPRLHDDMVLAITDHPLNYRFVDRARVHQAIRSFAPKVRLVGDRNASPHVTNLLIRHCDGLIVQNSKAIYSAAFFDKPILRLAHPATASWMKSYGDMDEFIARLADRTAACADEADVRTWFGVLLTHDIIDPATVSARELIDRVDRPFDAGRLRVRIER